MTKTQAENQERGERKTPGFRLSKQSVLLTRGASSADNLEDEQGNLPSQPKRLPPCRMRPPPKVTGSTPTVASVPHLLGVPFFLAL